MRTFWKSVLCALPLAATCFTVPAASAATAPSPWLQTNYDAANSRSNPVESTITAANTAGLHEAWSATAPDPEDPECFADITSPVISQSRVYAVVNHVLRVSDLDTGTTVWQADLDPSDSTSFGTLAVSHGLVLVGESDCGFSSDSNGAVVAYSSTNGAKVWSGRNPAGSNQLFGFEVFSKYVVTQYGCGECGSATTRVFRIANGSIAWTSNDPNATYAGRSVVDGQTFERSGFSLSGQLRSYRAYDGALRWTRSEPFEVLAGDTDRATGNNLIVRDIGTNAVSDLNPRTGATRFTLADAGTGNVAVDASRIYARCTTKDNHGCAYSTNNGAKVWQVPTSTNALPNAVAGGLLYLNDGTVRDAATGRLVTSLGVTPLAVGSGHVAAVTSVNDAPKLTVLAPTG